MGEDLIEQVNKDFTSDEESSKVLELLSSITLEDVMAESEYNLRNARFSILYLAKGNFEDLVYYVGRAKQDFRDVIYWAIEENKKNKA